MMHLLAVYPFEEVLWRFGAVLGLITAPAPFCAVSIAQHNIRQGAWPLLHQATACTPAFVSHISSNKAKGWPGEASSCSTGMRVKLLSELCRDAQRWILAAMV